MQEQYRNGLRRSDARQVSDLPTPAAAKNSRGLRPLLSRTPLTASQRLAAHRRGPDCRGSGGSAFVLRGEFVSPEALAKQVRHLDEEGAAVAAKARFNLAGKGIKAVAAEIVVVTDVESSTGIWRPAEKKLTLYV
jgi:hypothetical protein